MKIHKAALDVMASWAKTVCGRLMWIETTQAATYRWDKTTCKACLKLKSKNEHDKQNTT